MTIQYLPLSKLVPSPDNVRKTDRLSGIEQLAASIEAHGLLQNLQAKPASEGVFEVVAGSRRLAALKLLAKRKKIAPDFLVPCNALDGDNPAEISLAENEIRQAMHPADQFDAFKALAGHGMGDEEIAARFGVTVQVVRQRLKLARVSPKLIALYRKDEMTLDCLMAFAISDDHKQQEKIWKDLPEWSQLAMPTASAIRSPRRISRQTASWRVLSPSRPIKPLAVPCCATCSMPTVRAGLPTLPCSTALPVKSWNAKRKTFAPKAGNGSRSCRMSHGIRFAAYDRIYPTPTAPQQKALDKLHAARDKIDDEDSEWAEKLFAKLDKLESEFAFTAEQKAASGAIVTIG